MVRLPVQEHRLALECTARARVKLDVDATAIRTMYGYWSCGATLLDEVPTPDLEPGPTIAAAVEVFKELFQAIDPPVIPDDAKAQVALFFTAGAMHCDTLCHRPDAYLHFVPSHLLGGSLHLRLRRGFVVNRCLLCSISLLWMVTQRTFLTSY